MPDRTRAALAATLALATLLAVAPHASAQAPKSGGTLRAAMRAEVSTYDPHKGASGSDHIHSTGFYNPGGYKVPRVEELMDQAKATYKQDERRRIYQQIDEVVQQEAIDTPIYVAYSLEAMGTAVQGYQPNLLGKPVFRGVWLQAK